jgi:hypothetical protein
MTEEDRWGIDVADRDAYFNNVKEEAEENKKNHYQIRTTATP